MKQPGTAGGRVGVVAVDNGGRRQARRLSALAAVLVAAALAIIGRTPANAATGDITTVAGTGTSGYSGDGGPATAAQLNNPNSVRLDQNGDLLVADYSNNVVRRVDHATGVISTIAGTGAPGYSGDGGPATAAQFTNPYSAIADAQNNVIIVDGGNHVVRRVDHATGVVTTIAGTGTAGSSGDGGPATAATLDFPTFCAFDGAGNLFVSDYSARVVRRIDSGGVISTYAGTPYDTGYGGDGGPATSATFGGQVGITLDSAGDLFVADSGNQAVRKVDGATGIITTFAGGSGGYDGDGGPATSAKMNIPNDVTVDGSGNLFIADYSNHVVRLVNPAGNIFTVAGNGNAGYSGDGGPAKSAQLGGPASVFADSADGVYIADYDDNVVRKMTGLDPSVTTTTSSTSSTTTTTIPTLPAPTLFPRPSNTPLYPGEDVPIVPIGIAPGADGNIWFTRLDPNRGEYMTELGRVTPSGEYLRPYALAHDNVQDITLGADGNIWFVESGTVPEIGGASVGRITPDGQVTRFQTCGAGNCQQRYITTGPDGNVWFGSSMPGTAANSIDRVTPAGVVTAFPVPVGAATDLTPGPDGSVWFTNLAPRPQIGRIDPDGTITEYDMGANFVVTKMTTGPDGLLWLADIQNGHLRAITPDHTQPQVVADFGDVFPRFLTGGPDAVYFTAPLDPRQLGRATTAGVRFIDGRAATAGFLDLTTGPDGNVWALSMAEIARIQTPGPAPVLPKPKPVVVPPGPTIAGEICPPFDTNADPKPGTIINGNVDVIDNTYGCLLMNATVNGNVHIVDGAYADLEFTTVNGKVIVDSGGEVTMDHSRVTGGVVGTNAGFVNLWSTRVENGLVINGARNGLTYLCASTVNGGVSVSGVTDGTFPNLLGDPSHHCPANRVNGGLTFTNDHTQVVLNGNDVNGQIRCTGNTPAPTGGGNSGKKSGQCSNV